MSDKFIPNKDMKQIIEEQGGYIIPDNFKSPTGFYTTDELILKDNIKYGLLFEAKFDLIPVRYGDYYISSVAYTKTRKPYVKVSLSEKNLKPYLNILKTFIPKGFDKITDNIRLEAEISFKTKARADLDNRLKCLQDSLMKLNIIEDDSQIKELIIKDSGVIVKGTGATSIRIYRI